MRLFRNRRGNWLQIFLLLFFVLLLIIAVALLTMEAKRLEVTRPELGQDLSDQRANAVLISLLRSPTTLESRSTRDQLPVADLIIMNTDGRYDEAIRGAFTAMPQEQYFEATIEYPDGRVLQIYSMKELLRMREQQRGDSIIAEKLGAGTALLPGRLGNIKIRMALADPSILSLVGYKPEGAVAMAVGTTSTAKAE